MNEDDFDISCTDNFVFPYCGYEERDSWEYEEETDIVECGSCGEKFEYTRTKIILYDTRKVVSDAE